MIIGNYDIFLASWSGVRMEDNSIILVGKAKYVYVFFPLRIYNYKTVPTRNYSEVVL